MPFIRLSLVVIAISATVAAVLITLSLPLFGIGTPSTRPPTPTLEPELSTADAMRTIQDDLDKWNRDYGPDYDVTYRVTDIAINRTTVAQQTLGYVSFEEFNDTNMKLPLVYIHPNGTVLLASENGYENMGECGAGLSTYCGYLWPFNFDYQGRLVYGAEVLASNGSTKEPLFYVVDAVNGQIVDSTFLRMQQEINPPN